MEFRNWVSGTASYKNVKAEHKSTKIKCLIWIIQRREKLKIFWSDFCEKIKVNFHSEVLTSQGTGEINFRENIPQR